MKKDDLKLQNLKGTVDYLPEEQLARNYIISQLKETFELYGYLPVETSTLCPYELLASKYAGGAEILKEVYKLSDQGERALGLRYDLTVPFSKIIAANPGLQLPFRRYEIGKVYRDGPVKLGRMREFYQCDVDVCGIPGAYVEVEFFQMAKECYSKLGLDVIISWNNRKYLVGIIEQCGVASNLASSVILALDKFEKFGMESVEKELSDLGIAPDKTNQIFNLLKLDIQEMQNLANKNDTLNTGINEVISVQKIITDLGLQDDCKFTPSLARGLEIYTGTILEVFDKQQRIKSSLGGGGRYDKIITNFIDNGVEYPAVGMCFGLEPIYAVYSMMSQEKNLNKYDLQIFAFDLDSNVMKIAEKFRNLGIKTIIDFKNKKLKKSLDFANTNKIPFVAIIGEDEIKQNILTIKNLENGEQISAKFEDAVDFIK